MWRLAGSTCMERIAANQVTVGMKYSCNQPSPWNGFCGTVRHWAVVWDKTCIRLWKGSVRPTTQFLWNFGLYEGLPAQYGCTCSGREVRLPGRLSQSSCTWNINRMEHRRLVLWLFTHPGECGFLLQAILGYNREWISSTAYTISASNRRWPQADLVSWIQLKLHLTTNHMYWSHHIDP